MRARVFRGRPVWLWIGAGLDLLLLAPALYMAEGAVEVADETGWTGFADGIAVLVGVFPVFCLACPLAAFRNEARRKNPAAKGRFHGAVLLGAPLVYGLFLALLVLKS